MARRFAFSVLFLSVLLLVASEAFSCPFGFRGRLFRLRFRSPTPCVQHGGGTSSECDEAPCPAPAQSLDIDGTERQSLLQPGTVLEPVPSTGSKSPTLPILNRPDQPKTPPVEMLPFSQRSASISLAMDPATSERLSRISMLVEALLWLGGVIGGGSVLGRSLPLVARLVAGLQSLDRARSPVVTSQGQTSSSAQVSQS